MQTSVLLSIKPEFAKRIFDGSKLFEFRRKVFRDRSVRKVIVYVTAPIKRVLGEFDIEDVLELEIALLWEQTKEYSGIPKEYFDAYFSGRSTGYAIKIREARIYDFPLELERNFNIRHAPQSFIYVNQ